MRTRTVLSAIALLMLAILGSCQVATQQSQSERPKEDENCAGEPDPFGDEPAPQPEGAALVVSGDLNASGAHQVSLNAVRRIAINTSTRWGRRKVIVPPNLISANFTVERTSVRDTSSTNPLLFQITGLNARVKSFSYPAQVLTGENNFQINREKSFVRVYGSTGSVKVDGEAEARLTNRLFSAANPAIVKITFEGTYDFSKRRANLTKIKARGNSPTNPKEERN
jgi:hypothetical protein